MKVTWTDRPVLVFAHRGAAAEAPENTLAAFRRAGEHRTDYVELDVQETSDGVVVVVHDSDLMKVGRSPLKIWDFPRRAASGGGHRQPLLSRLLGRARTDPGRGARRLQGGVARGHRAEGLRPRRAARRARRRSRRSGGDAGSDRHDVVESSDGREDEAAPSGLDAGLLLAKAIGKAVPPQVDFLALESRMATRRFIRQAHAAGKPVYVWTVDDANRMVRMIGLGVDGLITNKPDLAKQVIAEYAEWSRPQRLFMFVMTTLGASQEDLGARERPEAVGDNPLFLTESLRRALLLEDDLQVVPSGRAGRVDRQGLPEIRLGLVEAPAQQRRRTEVRQDVRLPGRIRSDSSRCATASSFRFAWSSTPPRFPWMT